MTEAVEASLGGWPVGGKDQMVIDDDSFVGEDRVRRRILRYLHRDDTAHTVGELSVDLNLALTEV